MNREAEDRFFRTEPDPEPGAESEPEQVALPGKPVLVQPASTPRQE
jgi:hypothetical protein